MKQLSALDVYFMLKELDFLIGSKVNKIYLEKDDLIISLFKKNESLLKITPSAIYITKSRFTDHVPSNFCIFLRKRLNNAKLSSITQKNFERVIELKFKDYILIAELFGKGNIIACDSDYKILYPLHKHTFQHRTLKVNETYKYPPPIRDPFAAKREDFIEIKKDSLVKYLAVDFGLGGIYSEEICLRAGVDKNKTKLSENEITNLLKTIKRVKSLKSSPNIAGGSAFPFKLKLYDTNQPCDTFSNAIESDISKDVKAENPYEKELARLNRVLDSQNKSLNEIKGSILLNRKKGDMIYSNYAYIKEIYNAIALAKSKKIPWNEIESKLKTKGIILKGTKLFINL